MDDSLTCQLVASEQQADPRYGDPLLLAASGETRSGLAVEGGSREQGCSRSWGGGNLEYIWNPKDVILGTTNWIGQQPGIQAPCHLFCWDNVNNDDCMQDNVPFEILGLRRRLRLGRLTSRGNRYGGTGCSDGGGTIGAGWDPGLLLRLRGCHRPHRGNRTEKHRRIPSQ